MPIPTANVELTSDIPAETVTGPAGQVFQLQLEAERAQREYAYLYEQVAGELRAAAGPNQIVDSSMAYDHPDVVKARREAERAREHMVKAQAKLGGRVRCVAEENMEKVEKKIAALNRRGERIGSEKIEFTKTDEQIILHYTYNMGWEGRYEEDFIPPDASDFLHTYCIVSGGAPQVPGFAFVATIEHLEGGNLVNRLPSDIYALREGTKRNATEATLAQEIESVDLAPYRHVDSTCDHCGKKRDRKETFVVYNAETAETKRVGRSCLRDYTGIDDPTRLVKNIEQYREIDRMMSSRPTRPSLTMITFLTHCAAIMRDLGGYQKGLGYDAIANFNQVGKFSREGKPEWTVTQDSDQHDAARILHWALNEWDATNDFALNCKLALSQPVIENRADKNRPAGLAGAVFVAYDKWIERKQREESRKREEEGKERGFVGTEGERTDFGQVTVLKRTPRETMYGTGYTLRMEDPAGNIIIWFSSNLPRVKHGDYEWPVVGGVYKFRGTVKEHQDHERFGKSTIIKRGSFEETISLPSSEEIDQQEQDMREAEREQEPYGRYR